MKRLREEENDKIDDSLIISCICSGIFLHQYQPQDKICMIMTVMNGRKLTNSLYCLLLDECSYVLLSPLLIHTIIIEPVSYNNKWGNEKLSFKQYKCYKLKTILPPHSINNNRLYNKKNNLIKVDDIKILIRNTYYLYSIIFNSSSLEYNISELQRKILNNVFLKSRVPIINYIYGGHFFLIDLITTLFHITHQKNKEHFSKKQKEDNEEPNEDITVLSQTKPVDIWTTLYQRYSSVEKFFDDKFYDYQTKKQTKKYDDEDSIINEFRRWKGVDGSNIFYHRLNSYKYEIVINTLISNKFNEYGGLSYFHDKQIIKIYNILLTSIKYYDTNSSFKLKDKSIIKDFNNHKYVDKYFIIKKINIINIIIETIRDIFYKEDNEEKEEDQTIITGIFLDYFIDNLILYCKKELLKNCMTVYIIKFKTLLFIINQFFSTKFNDENDIENQIIIKGYNNTINNIYLNQFILLLFSKLPIVFKVNIEYHSLFSKDNNGKLNLYTELLCYCDNNDNNFKLEEINFNINKHKNILNKSFVTTSIDKFSPLILDFNIKNYSLDYLCVKKQDITTNKDLKSLESIINDNFNNCTIIYQNINYSIKRSNKFINDLIKSKETNLKEQINNDKQFLLTEFDEEIFDPDKEDGEEEKPIISIEYKGIQNIKNLKDIKKDRMKLLIILDCHLLDINEWYNLFNWIISNLKKSIKNVIFIGCPFMNLNKSFGQPFIDSLFQINENATKSLLYNRININSNKQIQENKEMNQLFFQKDSFTTLSLLTNVFK